MVRLLAMAGAPEPLVAHRELVAAIASRSGYPSPSRSSAIVDALLARLRPELDDFKGHDALFSTRATPRPGNGKAAARRAGCEALARAGHEYCGARGVKKLVDMVRDRDPAVRRAAVDALVSYGPEAVAGDGAAALLRLCGSFSREVRDLGHGTLERLRTGAEWLPPLAGEEDRAAFDAAHRGKRHRLGEAGMDALQQLLSSPVLDVRVVALKVAGDADLEARSHAFAMELVHMLGEWFEGEHLRKAEVREVRDACVEALGKMQFASGGQGCGGGGGEGAGAGAGAGGQRGVPDEYRDWGEQAVALAVSLLGDGRAEVRAAAVAALGHVHHEILGDEAATAMTALLADLSDAVVEAAYTALGNLASSWSRSP